MLGKPIKHEQMRSGFDESSDQYSYMSNTGKGLTFEKLKFMINKKETFNLYNQPAANPNKPKNKSRKLKYKQSFININSNNPSSMELRDSQMSNIMPNPMNID